MNALHSLETGIVAGAFGAVVLDLATFTDMALRARTASSMPAQLVKNVAKRAGVEVLAARGESADNRRQGVGAILGYANGLAVGAVFGLLRATLAARLPRTVVALSAGAAAMALSDIPATKYGVTDPAKWGVSGWLADAIPHALYGGAVVAAFDRLYRS